MSLIIRQFRREDIEFAVSQTTREGWENTRAEFSVCLAHDPNGCFIAEIDRRPVGMMTTTPYAQSAWLGNLIVMPDARRQGIGERLMTHAVRQLEGKGIRTIRLEADPLGIGIYRWLGFVDQFESLRFCKEPPHRGDRCGVRRMTDDDLGAVQAFDTACFGDDRSGFLSLLMADAKATYCVCEQGSIRGFALVLSTRSGVRFGPCATDSPTTTERLLDAAFADFPDVRIMVGVPGVNVKAAELLESRGFTQTPSSLRMVHGEPHAEADPSKLMAIANVAVG